MNDTTDEEVSWPSTIGSNAANFQRVRSTLDLVLHWPAMYPNEQYRMMYPSVCPWGCASISG